MGQFLCQLRITLHLSMPRFVDSSSNRLTGDEQGAKVGIVWVGSLECGRDPLEVGFDVSCEIGHVGCPYSSHSLEVHHLKVRADSLVQTNEDEKLLSESDVFVDQKSIMFGIVLLIRPVLGVV